MKSMKRIALMAGVAATAIMFTAPTFAQETTSSLRGKIVSVSGEPLANVEVVITHVPSGSRSTISTNSSGVFYARGLAVGGPYHVKLADGSEFTATDIDDLYLQLGQSSTVNITARIGGDMEEIVATGQRVSSSIKTGASSLYGRTDLDDMPSIGRDIKSVLQQDPTIWIDSTNSNAMSIAGTNNRMNSITVDGIRQNDDFGLNGNGYPTQRSPVSLDAIEQVAVQTAPFDVNYGNFQGGNINIVTKSGTNEFHGGAFFEYSDDSFVGSKSKGETYDSSAFEEKTYGVTLGGPIIKDKLFFFASYEKYESTRPFEFGPEGSGAANEIS
ncbi:MAG: TonB-dependent receptor, partial [Sphingomonadales bacterium]|nr:TonB-dependent receptor [Sphingomonadales bacterium]